MADKLKKKMSDEADFYMEWAMTSLEQLQRDPYTERGKDFYAMIEQLDTIMDRINSFKTEEERLEAFTTKNIQ